MMAKIVDYPLIASPPAPLHPKVERGASVAIITLTKSRANALLLFWRRRDGDEAKNII